MFKKVGIILINYQDYAARFLSACRDSLRAQDYPADLINVYIVDNASTVATFSYLKANYPEARILTRSDGNYAAASNLGFLTAIADGCEYLVSVNLDTEMTPGWLKELVKALDENPTAGLAQSKIFLYPKNEEEKANPRINSLGNVIHFLGFGFTSAYLEADRDISGYPEISGYASGCSFIIRREVFEKIGGYNEDYYMYHDDLELSLKARLAGFKIILAPLSVIYHKYEFNRSKRMIYYMERNRYLTLLIFYPVRALLLVGLPGLIMDCGLLFYSVLSGWFSEEMKIYRYFCSSQNYVRIRQARENLKRISVVPFSQVSRDFSGRLEFQEIANPLLKYFINPVFAWYWRCLKRFI